MKAKRGIAIALLSAALLVGGFFLFRATAYPRPYRQTVEDCGVAPELIYAVMKAESGFREDALSEAGAVGLMQLKPSTAQYICSISGIRYEEERLTEGEYNLRLGAAYLRYLFERFPATETALAAYNAGEGTVRGWLLDVRYSADGIRLDRIPFAETRVYVKKVEKFRKIYEILYG